jgi:hypothetical protein
MGAIRSVWNRLSLAGKSSPDTEHRNAMQAALERLHLSSLQISEARTLEELDLGRAAQLSALAELQQVIRVAKRDRGIPLRSVAECEELHQNLISRFRQTRSAAPARPVKHQTIGKKRALAPKAAAQKSAKQQAPNP